MLGPKSRGVNGQDVCVCVMVDLWGTETGRGPPGRPSFAPTIKFSSTNPWPLL